MFGKEDTGNVTKSPAMDPTNSYHVHPSDQPRHMLVSTKLNDTNYQLWKIAMVHALTTKKKLGFVDCSHGSRNGSNKQKWHMGIEEITQRRKESWSKMDLL